MPNSHTYEYQLQEAILASKTSLMSVVLWVDRGWYYRRFECTGPMAGAERVLTVRPGGVVEQ